MMTPRRAVLTALGGLIAAPGLLSGCSSSVIGGRKQTTIRFWNGFTGPDGRTMLGLVRKFNAENPDVHVVMQRMDWGTFYNKLFVAGLGGRAPECFVLHTRAMLRFALAGFATPLDTFVASENGLPEQDFEPGVWDATTYKSEHFGIPLDVHAMGMYTNRALLKEVDWNPEAPPVNTAEFIDVCKRVRKLPKQESERYGFVFTNLETNGYTLIRQFGGNVFTPDMQTCILNSPENQNGLMFGRSLIEDGLVPSPENFDAWIGFRQGRVAMAFEGIYMLADLQRQKDLDYGGAPVPQFGNTKAVWADSHNLCMRRGLDAPTAAATWRFMRFLSNNSLDWALGGQIPTRVSQLDSPEFAKMEVQAQFAKQVKIVKYHPKVPFIFEYLTEFTLAVEKILRGREKAPVALKTAEDNINRIIDRQRKQGVSGGDQA
ncbi:MAG: hypothetical protein RJA02_511 [Armatimonadota bacterium]